MSEQPARQAVYSELMWPEFNQTSESYGAGDEKANALLDAHAAEAQAAAQPTTLDRRRTTWPTAVELQRAADILRNVAPQIEGPLAGLADPVADWLDETANALSWLAPYRDSEPGYGMWETAMVVARKILGTAEPEPAEVDAQAVVAYRHPDRPSVLLCRAHGQGWRGLTPLTSDDLPDGGICTWGDCGVDVLIARPTST